MAQRKSNSAAAKKRSPHVLSIIRSIAPFIFRSKRRKRHTGAKRTAAARGNAAAKTRRRTAQHAHSTTKRRTAAKPHRSASRTARHKNTPAAKKSVRHRTAAKKSSVSTAKRSSAHSKRPVRSPVTEVRAQKRTPDRVSSAAQGTVAAPLPKKKTGHLYGVQRKDAVEEFDGSVEVLRAALPHESGWMSRVRIIKKRLDQPIHPVSAWNMMRARLERSPKQKAPKEAPLQHEDVRSDAMVHVRDTADAVPVSPKQQESESTDTKKQPRHGLFGFRRAAQKDDDTKEVNQTSEPPASSSSHKAEKENDLSAAELRREAKEASEAAKRLEKEFNEMRKERERDRASLVSHRAPVAEARQNTEAPDDGTQAVKSAAAPQKTSLAPAPAEQPIVHSKKPAVRRAGVMRKIAAAIGYIGLGKERIQFIQNMATMLNAGLPLIDALKTLIKETRAKPMKKLIQRILDAVENGSALWRAMDEQNFFSLHAIALVRIGEEAGNLAENMGYLAEQEEKDNALRSKVKMAMIYPTIVLVLMFIIIMVLGMFVLPNLIGVLFSLNVELPLVTRIIVQITNLFTTYGAVGIPSMIAGFILMVILAKFTPLKAVFQWIMFRIPGIGRLAREATIARFGVILGGLLRAGVPIIEAIQSLVEVTPIVAYKTFYARLLDHITVGDSFARSFERIKRSGKLLPPSVQQLVITGEKSGALAEIMLKVAEIYDKKAANTAEKLPVILEPMLLLFIGGLVGTIAFAIIVPIYSIVGSVGQ